MLQKERAPRMRINEPGIVRQLPMTRKVSLHAARGREGIRGLTVLDYNRRSRALPERLAAHQLTSDGVADA